MLFKIFLLFACLYLLSLCFYTKRRTAALWLLFSFSFLRAQDIVITDGTPDILLDEHNTRLVTVVDEVGHTLPLADSVVWLLVKVDKQTEAPFLLEGLSPHAQHLHVWIQQDAALLSYQQAGRDISFGSRWISHKNFTFPLPTQKGSYSIWIALENPEEGDVAFKIRSFHFFSEYAFVEYFFLGLYYGLLLIAGLYNLFLYLKSNIRLHLYYASYMVGCILLSFKEDGLGFQFLWPSLPLWNQIFIFHLAKPFFLSSFLLYSFAFLGLRKRKPVISLLFYIALAYGICEFLSLFIPSFKSPTDGLMVLAGSLIYFTSLSQYRYDRFSRYFAWGFSVVVVSLLINVLRAFSLIPSNILTVYSFNYGIFFEVIIFSVALAERVKDIQEERNEALSNWVKQLEENDHLQKQLILELEEKEVLQDKVNKELELKVQDRTTELQAANLQLKEYAKKVDQLNSALDLHNFSLKKEVKQSTLSLINAEIVPYEKFLEIFPSEHHCLKNIESLKWPRGFVCEKCGNTQSSSVKVWYRRKCTRCATIESVTANTLLHNTRIPLQKAFYITYLTCMKADLTLDEVSMRLELRKATVWSFKKKVEEKIASKNNQKVDSWLGLIMNGE